HEAGDVLQEDERDAALARELDEVRALLRRLGEQHAVVREDADWIALDSRKARDERLAVERLELVEARAVDDAANQLARVRLVTEVLRDEPVQLARICSRRFWICDVPRRLRLARVQVADDLACEGERVLVRRRVVVGDARLARVDVCATELL